MYTPMALKPKLELGEASIYIEAHPYPDLEIPFALPAHAEIAEAEATAILKHYKSRGTRR